MGNLADMKYLHPAAPGNDLQRLLIPIDASAESRWGLRHAVQLAAAGQPVERAAPRARRGGRPCRVTMLPAYGRSVR